MATLVTFYQSICHSFFVSVWRNLMVKMADSNETLTQEVENVETERHLTKTEKKLKEIKRRSSTANCFSMLLSIFILSVKKSTL